ncbi:MAG TPA: type II and III secretion system protein family protein [Longimicrobiales bacterium]
MSVRNGNGAFRVCLPGGAVGVLLLALSIASAAPRTAHAQQVFTEPQRVISVAKGRSALYQHPTSIARISFGDPNVVDVQLVSEREAVINARELGTTSLFIWDRAGGLHLFTIEVTADAASLERYLRALFPDEQIMVTASGNTVTLSGQVSSAVVAQRALEVARTTGAQVIDAMQAPALQQVLLQVRFAEVNRSAISQFGTELSTLNPQLLNAEGDWSGETLSDGLVRLFLLNADAQIEAVIRALKSRGLLRTLAEPNLLTLPGREASFLAGGEFPYPTVQGGAGNNAVTITFKEFGVRLRFTPTITNTGSIRLRVAPEVSSLDFANGLTFGGFQIPALLTRRAETEVELREGQHLAIAGLIDNSITDNLDKIPILGDIPILGLFFRSKDVRQNRTELLVIVTPRLVQPTDTPPPLPTGEPETWRWDRWLRYPSGAQRRGGGAP